MEKPRGRRVRVRVRTAHAVYIGTIFIPEMRNRLSDLLNDRDRGDFISLTQVYINDRKEMAEFVCVNKRMIESVEPYE